MIREAQAQLAGPMYMNSREDAAIAVKGMESRVHQDNEELRKQGVKQYLHTVKKKHNQKILDKEAAVSTEVDLSKEQYEQVNEHMSDERNPGHTEPGKTNGTTPSRRRRTAGQNQNDNGGTPKEQTPEEKAKEGAVAEFTKGVAATKTLHDKLARELGDVCLIEAKLKAKKWDTTGPIQYLKEKTEAIKVLNDGLFAQWLAAREFLNMQSEHSTEAFTTETGKLKKHGDEVTEAYKAYTRETLSEFTKLK